MICTPQFVTMVTMKVSSYYSWAVGAPAKWGNRVPNNGEISPYGMSPDGQLQTTLNLATIFSCQKREMIQNSRTHPHLVVTSHNTLMKFSDELRPVPGHRSHPCHIHITSAHIPHGQHQTPTLSFPIIVKSHASCYVPSSVM